MRGGRGFSRGGFSRGGGSSYRGSSGSSYRGGGSSSRGGSSSSSYSGGKGRYNYDNYSSSSHGNRYNSGNQYGNRDHSSGPPFKRRNDRDFRSPDRKRVRNDHHQGMPPPRRSHDSYGSSADRGYSGGGSYDKSSHYRGGSGSRMGRHSHHSPPPSRGTSFRSQRSDSFSSGGPHRRPEAPMGPPPSRTNRIQGYRGRLPPSSRGGGILRRGGVSIARKRIDMRMKVRSREILQQKLARMRSTIRKRPAPARTTSESSSKKENEEKKIKAEDEEWEKASAKDESTDAISPAKVKSEAGDGEKEAADGADAENESTASGQKEDKPKRRSSDDENLPKSRFTGKSFIKLTCIHCCSKFLTFKAYSRHLYGGAHKATMYRLSRDLKEKLASMRLKQRAEQREMEKDLTEDEINTRPHFCLLCRLSYRQEKSVHQNSDAHKSMRRFLLPYCGTCKLSFKSPIAYETHRCSLEHIKRKARVDAAKNADNSGDELDLENFMTLDSVGSVDGECFDNDDPTLADANEEGASEEVAAPKREINVGSEYLKKVETLYCELCRIYLSHRDDQEKVLKEHCGVRSHLRAFLRHKEDRTLRKEAERVHRKQHEEEDEGEEGKKKTTDGEEKEDGVEKDEGAGEDDAESSIGNTQSQNEMSKGEETEGEEKLWADVDKDLGELLNEVQPEGEEEENDDEDDEDSRPDNERFRNSEKNAEKVQREGNDEKDGAAKTENGDIKENGTAEVKA
ncbi:zinc finger protein on ecdysone puffs isoform X2 [Lutzomyia longipalpis]|uniref:zinc finger protein on ecdysone puffs isoform X2 n=1 Tax=Lutzomyia longipalpis TaxID=7200 RepID=UPI00248409DA|nr:zinc finger protein on ecdysone puffs isoform X2 [Lutzomyia longipalpis]